MKRIDWKKSCRQFTDQSDGITFALAWLSLGLILLVLFLFFTGGL